MRSDPPFSRSPYPLRMAQLVDLRLCCWREAIPVDGQAVREVALLAAELAAALRGRALWRLDEPMVGAGHSSVPCSPCVSVSAPCLLIRLG